MKARFFALAALVLGLASCQQEFDGAATQVGGEVDFQLKVDAKELATRAEDGDNQYGYDSAYGAIDYLCDEADPLRIDWTDVDLRYTLEVYDANGLNAAPVKDRMVQIVDKYEPVTFDLRLVPNRDYQFVVFADFVPQGASAEANTDIQKNLGLHHVINGTLQNITIKEDAINDECTDAYFATEPIRISNSAAQSIILKRPYGKVRVIATDLAELNLNVNPQRVQVDYTTEVPTTFNAVNGKIGTKVADKSYVAVLNVTKEDMSNHLYTKDYDAKTTTNANGETRFTHVTLFTDYILAEKESQTPYNFTLTVFDDQAGQNVIKETHFNTDIPVARNMLTTVVGNVLTTATEINVTIDDDFATKYTLTMWDGKSIKEPKVVNGAYEIYEAAELAWVADQANNKKNTFKNTTVKLCKDIHLNGERWTPISKFEGTFEGQNHVIEGLFVKVDDKTYAGLFGFVKYVNNLKVCHAEVYGHYKVGVITGDGVCSRINNCHVENAVVVATPLNKDDGNHAGGIVGYLSGETEAYVKNSSVKNATIIAYRDVAAIAGTANQYAVVTDNKVENVTVIADQTNEYKERKVANVDAIAGRVHAKATIENNTATNADVYVKVNTADNLEYQIANESRDIKVVLCGDINGDVTVGQNADVNVTIDGNGHNYKGVIVVDGKSATYTTAGLTIKNLNFNADEISADACIRLGNGDNNTRYTCNVTVERCTFDVPGAVGVKSYTGGDKILTISNCTATANAHSLLQAAGIDGIRVEGCTVNSKNGLNFNQSDNIVIDNTVADVRGYAVRFGASSGDGEAAESYLIKNSTLKSACEDGDAVIILRGTADKATLNLINTTIEGNTQILNNAADANVYVDGAIVASSAEALNNAIAAGNDAYLFAGEYTMPAVSGKTFAISGTRDAVITVNKPNLSGSNVTFEGVTVKGSGYATGVQHVNNVTYNDVKVIGEMCLYGENVVFNNCEFVLNNQYIWTYGAKNAAFNNCVFNTNGKAILVYNEGAGACEVAVNGCTFNATAGAKAGAIANQNCAAIEIDNFQSSGVGAAHKVSATNNTYSENFSGEWRIKNFVAGNAITVNGVAYEQIAVDGKKMTIDADKNVTVL